MSTEIKCPYYGHHYSEQFWLTPQEGNQCPFKKGYAPYHMEVQKTTPNWRNCDYNLEGHNPVGELAILAVFRDELKNIQSIDEFARKNPDSPLF